MNRKVKHLISTIIATILYLLTKNDDVEKESTITSQCIELNERNMQKLCTGEWLVVASNCLSGYPARTHDDVNVAVLNVTSFKQAKIAAKLGITDWHSIVYIKNGRFVKNGSLCDLNEHTQFVDILDFYVFHSILNIKELMKSKQSLSNLLNDSTDIFIKTCMELFEVYN